MVSIVTVPCNCLSLNLPNLIFAFLLFWSIYPFSNFKEDYYSAICNHEILACNKILFFILTQHIFRKILFPGMATMESFDGKRKKEDCIN